MLLGCVAALVLTACEVNTPTFEQIRDSKYIDRRIKETPRQKVVRECQQECDRYRVSCLFCHGTQKAEEIQPENWQFTPAGKRAQIMRKSPSFGLNQDCATCHQSKFALNRYALKLYGAGGAKRGDAQAELKADTGADGK